MYLRALEIQGFKSFPDKTILNFGDDITAIVGPNGSGKSNISDAIRWVMGEQSTKALRGAKMEDVIFGGTQKRAQVGFAEASLIFDNSDGAFPMEEKEIMVTRRYYRSGESEYYINRQSARLRDINELFMDTGLGREGYSNISQGRIDEILSVKSTDRREVFEEAAGISKYRHRKEETERRLANTEDNLLRIGDKISELELQVEPLREQAEKAKKYLACRDSLRGLETAVWLDTLDKLSETARKAEENYNSSAFILQQAHDDLSRLYVTAESLTFELHAQDLKTEAMREAISGLEAEAQRGEGQIEVLRGTVDNNRKNMERIRAELSDQESRSGSVEEQIAQREARASEIEAQSAALAERISEAQEEGRKLTASAEGMTRQYLQLRSRQSQLQSELAARRAELAAAEASLRQTQERSGVVQADAQAAGARSDEAHAQLDNAQRTLREAGEEVTACQNSIAGYQLRAASRAERRDLLLKKTNALAAELDATRARLKLFREMEREYEGFSKAVKFIMQESDRGALRNIRGPISSLIKTDDEYTLAIEIALGSAMQQIVVDTEQDAKYAIHLLKSKDNGRATFLPLSAIAARPLQEKNVSHCRGFVGIASELVRCDSDYSAIVSNLLGRTVICEDLDTAIAMAKEYEHRFRIVTLDGQVMNAGGSMTGGSVSRNTGLLTRANEIEKLSQKETSLCTGLEEAKTALAEAERSMQQVEFEMSAVQGQLRQAQDEVLRLTGEEKQYTVLTQAIEEAIASSKQELSALQAREKTDSDRKIALEVKAELLEEQLSALTEELSEVSEGQSAAAEESNRLGERVTKLRMDAAALDAEKATAQDAAEKLRELARAMQGDAVQKQALISQYEAQNAQLEERIQEAQAQQAQQAETIEAKRAELKQALAERAVTEARKTRTEKEAQQKNKDILDMERESARLENRKNTAELEEKQIVDKLWDTYELTRTSAAAACAQIESVAQANREITALRRSISALGTPNLGAIEEFDRVNERYQYLSGQRDDVQTSKRELEAIVRDITTQMTEIFVREFARIDTFFGQTFTEMFGGGKASLLLEDPDDPLSCGIEIRVQPPGKQLKTITLLSGGEKAFVAIALYFAILKVRPTPFCMLDEIDAALDDRNVERFASYLRGLCKNTQFIVITHRRGTMEAADILYGVTMQEQGVSKILHMDLNQMQKQLGIAE